MNRLYYGDNLDIMRRCIKDEWVDVVYLDPPSTAAGTTISSLEKRATCLPARRAMPLVQLLRETGRKNLTPLVAQLKLQALGYSVSFN